MNIEEFFKSFCESIGEDPLREGLSNTPKRISQSWNDLYCGYKKDPEDIFKNSYKDGICNEMIVLKNIEFYSMCEHHLLPFFGKITIGYIPKKHIVGISNFAQLVELYARRLQIQENMTTQIADAIMKYVEPRGVMVVCEATHMCMVMRGVEKKSSTLLTSALRGIFKEDSKTRAEFMSHLAI